MMKSYETRVCEGAWMITDLVGYVFNIIMYGVYILVLWPLAILSLVKDAFFLATVPRCPVCLRPTIADSRRICNECGREVCPRCGRRPS
jgi:hypothetical protein